MSERKAVKQIVGALLLSLLAGCSTIAVQDARDPLGRMIGSTLPDLIDCMGKPDANSFQQTTENRATIQWSRKDTSTALKVTAPLLGAIEVGGGGACTVVITVLREGTIVNDAFPNCYNDGFFAEPYAAAYPLIHECLAHPNNTGKLPTNYDAFMYLNGTVGKKS